MSRQADIIRSDRQALAAPGGPHDRLVSVLSRVLPAAIGMLAALMIITPLSPRGEISFLLDRNKVAVVRDRLRVDNAMYRGEDDKGRPFSLTAGQAVQHSAREGIVRMQDLSARILLADGPAVLSAARGRYDIENQRVSVQGPVQFSAVDGYRMVARDVTVDLDSQRMVGQGRVDGAIPAGTFSADRIIADLVQRTITLDGNARLHMIPGKLRIPQ
jgi:lipopolysaccharide export system protein LptC